MSVRKALKINYGDSFVAPVKNDWQIALLPADGKTLTYEFDSLVEFCRKESLDLLAEFYFYPSIRNEEIVELSIDIEPKSTREVEQAVKEFAFIQNAVLTTSDYQLILVVTHDEIGIMLGSELVIRAITGHSADSLNHSFGEYIREWRAGHRRGADALLKLATTYPISFNEGEVVEVDLESGKISSTDYGFSDDAPTLC